MLQVSEVLAFLASQSGAKFVSGCGVKKVLTERAASSAFDMSGQPVQQISKGDNLKVMRDQHCFFRIY